MEDSSTNYALAIASFALGCAISLYLVGWGIEAYFTSEGQVAKRIRTGTPAPIWSNAYVRKPTTLTHNGVDVTQGHLSTEMY